MRKVDLGCQIVWHLSRGENLLLALLRKNEVSLIRQTQFVISSMSLMQSQIRSPFADSFSFMLGANFTDIAVQNAHPHLAYSVVDVNNKPMIQTQFTNTDNLLITPENITATILSSLKTTAESHVQRPVTQAFIAVPSSFTEAQRDLIRATASATGMVVNRIMSSTVATVSGYGMHLEEDEHPCKPKPYHGLIYHLEEQQSKIAVWHDYGQDITEVVDERLGGSAMGFGDEDANRVSEFEKGVRDILASALKKANLTKSEITETVFTGNSTQTARFQSVVDTYLGFQARSHSLPSGELVSPDEAILRGVTIAASWWENRHSGGIMEYDWDILPLSLGIEDRDGRFVPIMKNNYIIPLRRNQSFVTATDGQDTVVVDVYEGARLVAGKNNHLGTLRLENLQPREIGEVEIEVVFEVDQCYALTVWVKEKESGREEMLDVELDYWDGRNTSALWMEATMMREEDEGVLVQRMSEGEHAVFGVLKKDVPDEE